MMAIAHTTLTRAVLRVRHGVEADQDVRQSGGAEDQRQAERDQVERAVRRLVAQAGLRKFAVTSPPFS